MRSKKNEGNFTGGSLLIRESRVVAKLLAEKHSREEIVRLVLSRNLLQNSSKATTQKYCQLALIRLGTLTDEQIHFVASGREEICRMTLLLAVLKTYPIIADFMRDVVAEKVRCFETHLEKKDWMRFLQDRARTDASIKEWSETSQRKMGQVVIRMMAEAGFLDSTRKMSILFPIVPPELEHALGATGDAKLMVCMKLGR